MLDSIKMGKLLITTQFQSKQLKKQNKKMERQNTWHYNWINGIQIIIQVEKKYRFKNFNSKKVEVKEPIVRALGVHRQLKASPRNFTKYFPEKKRKFIKIRHLIGGPCPTFYGPYMLIFLSKSAIRCFNLTSRYKILFKKDGHQVILSFMKNTWNELCKKAEKYKKIIDVFIIYGEAGWTYTQILSELAIGFWGICSMKIGDIFSRSSKMCTLKWKEIWNNRCPKISNDNEMKRIHNQTTETSEAILPYQMLHVNITRNS